MCISPPSPSCSSLFNQIKAERRGEREIEGESGGEREVWDVCSLVLESIICLNRMNDDGVNMKFGRLNHCLSECVGDCLYRSLSPPRSICLHLSLSLLVILMICFVLVFFFKGEFHQFYTSGSELVLLSLQKKLYIVSCGLVELCES